MTVYFGENLKKLRKSKDLTQEAFADFLGMSFQAISKWERGESYPDITMLPTIASFFGVTVDSLLGTNEIENEKKRSEYIEEYLCLCNEGKFDDAVKLIKKAAQEFPGNYDILSKYLSALTNNHSHEDGDYLISVKPEMQRIYDIICNYCTDDSIRIWSKRNMCLYLRDLSLVENSGVDISEAEAILAEMPIMRNTRDYVSMYMYPFDDEKRSLACANGISEMLRLFGEIMNRKYKNFLDANDDVSQAYINLVEAVMPDGDYGKSYYLMVIYHQRLGVKKYLAGDIKGALQYFEKALALAKKYDEMPEISIHTSDAVRGIEFDKTKAYRFWEGSFYEDVKEGLINRPQLSDEFKNSKEFKALFESE